MSIRTRSMQNKISLPANLLENHYYIVELEVNEDLLTKYSQVIDHLSDKPYQKFYYMLYKEFFAINEDAGLENTQFIANDKFTQVRYSVDKLTIQTKEQNLFLYNPKYHFGQNIYFDGAVLAKKIQLLYLPNGNELRVNAEAFHQKVKHANMAFSKRINVNNIHLKVFDHQNFSYDLFAKEKGVDNSITYKLRPITTRYIGDDESSSEPDKEDVQVITFVVADLSINSRIRKLVNLDMLSKELYGPLYNLIATTFIEAAKKHGINNGVILANDLMPVVIPSDNDTLIETEELQIINNNNSSEEAFICQWSVDKLVDTVKFVIKATAKDKTSAGYGKFLNQIQKLLATVAEELSFNKEKEEMIIHFHQYILFSINEHMAPDDINE